MVYATLGKKFISGREVDQRERNFRLLLGRDEAELPATPADIGVLPVPVQSGKDLSVVVGNFAEVDDQAC
jgi:hypothetical protein